MPEKIQLVEISFIEKRKFKFPKIERGRGFYLFLLSFISLLAIPIFYYVQYKILNEYQYKLSKLDRKIRAKNARLRYLKARLSKEQRIFEKLYIADLKEKYFVSRLYKYFNRAIYSDFKQFNTALKGNLYKSFIVFPNPLKLNTKMLIPKAKNKGIFLENINPFKANLNIATAIAIYVKNDKKRINIKQLNLIKDKKLRTNLEFQWLLLNRKYLDLLIPVTLIYPVSFFYKDLSEKQRITKALKNNCIYFIKQDYFEYNRLMGKLLTEGYLQGFCIRTNWYKVRDKIW